MADEITLEQTEEQTEEQQAPRELNVLMGLELTELTPEELEIVVEEKARVKARDQQHAERMEALNQNMKALAEIERENARRFEQISLSLTQIALKRYEEASRDDG